MTEQEVLDYMDARSACMADVLALDIMYTRLEIRNSMCDWRKEAEFVRWLKSVGHVERIRIDRAGMQARYGDYCRGQRADW
jgi:hypothetical protein